MQEVADLTVLDDHRQPIIKTRVDGTPGAFVVDTGATLSLITPKVASLLSLPVKSDHRYAMQGTGGALFACGAELQSLDLGSSIARTVEFAMAGGLGGTVDGLPLVGLFGVGFVADDVAFDLPAHHAGLCRERNCAADPRSLWTGPATASHTACSRTPRST